MAAFGRFGAMALCAAAFAVTSGEWRSAQAGLVYLSTTNGYGQGPTFETLDTVTGAVNVISASAPLFNGLQFINGQLYGEGNGQLYRVDPTTGAATSLGTITAPLTGDGGATYVTGPNGQIDFFDGNNAYVYSLTPPSPTASQTNLPLFASFGLYASAPDGQIAGLVLTGNTQSGYETLEYLDPTTGVVTAGPVLSTIFANYSRLFYDGSTLYAFDGSSLDTINTTTGVVTPLGITLPPDGNTGQVVYGVAVMPSFSSVPEPSSLMLCGIAGAFVTLAGRWRRLAPGRRPLV